MTNYQTVSFNAVNSKLDPQGYTSFGKVTTNNGGEPRPVKTTIFHPSWNYALIILEDNFDGLALPMRSLAWFWDIAFVLCIALLAVVLGTLGAKYDEKQHSKFFPSIQPARKPARKPPCTKGPKEAPPIIYVPPREDKL